MRRRLLSEKDELLHLVKAECEDIVREAHSLMRNGGQMLEKTNLSSKMERFGSSNLLSGSKAQSIDSDSKQSMILYPEMLSPEETHALVKIILERASISSWDQLKFALGINGLFENQNLSSKSVEKTLSSSTEIFE
jgi:hypothetical protein